MGFCDDQSCFLAFRKKKLRDLIVVLLQSCEISNPAKFWKKFKEDLSEDCRHQGQLLLPNIDVCLSDEFYNRALIDIENRLLCTGGDKHSAYDLPFTNITGVHAIPTGVIQEIAYDVDALKECINENEPKLLEEQ